MTIRYAEIKKMCDDMGISISELERECGFAKGSLCKIDKHKPRKEKMEKLEEVFLEYAEKRKESSDNIQYSFGSGKSAATLSTLNNLSISNFEEPRVGYVAESIPTYYANSQASEFANFLLNNPEYKVLFDASRKVKPEDISKALKAIGIFIDED